MTTKRDSELSAKLQDAAHYALAAMGKSAPKESAFTLRECTSDVWFAKCFAVLMDLNVTAGVVAFPDYATLTKRNAYARIEAFAAANGIDAYHDCRLGERS